MVSAYQCYRCGDFQEGSGSLTVYGTKTRNPVTYYDTDYEEELCDECKKELNEIVEDFFS